MVGWVGFEKGETMVGGYVILDELNIQLSSSGQRPYPTDMPVEKFNELVYSNKPILIKSVSDEPTKIAFFNIWANVISMGQMAILFRDYVLYVEDSRVMVTFI